MSSVATVMMVCSLAVHHMNTEWLAVDQSKPSLLNREKVMKREKRGHRRLRSNYREARRDRDNGMSRT